MWTLLLLNLDKVAAVIAALGAWYASIVQGKKTRRVAREMATELKPNHGGSIKDQITRMESKIDELTKAMLTLQMSHAENITATSAQLLQLSQRIAHIEGEHHHEQTV